MLRKNLFRDQILCVGKIHVKKHFSFSNMMLEIKSADCSIRNADGMKKDLYSYNICRVDDTQI